MMSSALPSKLEMKKKFR